MSSQLAPLRVHRLQHLDPPSHHVFTAIPSKGNGGGNGIGIDIGIGIGAWLPHWNAVPERFFHPRHRSGHPNHDPADPLQDLDEHPDTHLLRIGFQNPWPSFIRPSFSQIWHALRWGVPPPHFEPDTSHTERKELRRRMRNDPELHLAVQTPDFTHQRGSVKATWLGHAGTLLTVPPLNARTEPFRILFDPIFSNRCSPLRGAGPLRAYPPPCQVSDLPPIDLVIISHNHYDHLDYDTISDLWAANEQRGIRFVAPLGNKTWFTQEGLGIDPQRVVDLDWWDELVLGGAQVLPASASASAEKEDEKEEPTLHAEVQVPATSVLEDEQSASPPQPATSTSTSTSKHEAAELAHSLHDGLTPRERDALQEPELPFLRIICTPAQHQSGRYAVDACSALWSSWVVEYHHSEGEDKERRCFRTFFGGDTGYRFHDTIAAAEREAEAKANQQKRKEAHRKKKQQARASLDGAGNASPLKKLGKRFSLSSKSSRSSASSSGRTNTPRGSGVVNEEPVQTADLPNGSQNNNKESNDDEEEPPILISELEDLAEKKHPSEGEDESSFPACPAFTNIRTVLGTPDLLLLPISVGATISFLKSYDPLPPKWSPFPRVDERLTSAVHMGPEDAVRVFQLMTERAAEEEEGEYGPPASAHLRRFAHLASGSGKGRGRGATALAIHWGTFVGGKDEVHQSIRALRRACGKEGVRFVRQSQRGGEPEAGEGEGEKDGRNTFALVNHGESVVVRL